GRVLLSRGPAASGRPASATTSPSSGISATPRGLRRPAATSRSVCRHCRLTTSPATTRPKTAMISSTRRIARRPLMVRTGGRAATGGTAACPFGEGGSAVCTATRAPPCRTRPGGAARPWTAGAAGARVGRGSSSLRSWERRVGVSLAERRVAWSYREAGAEPAGQRRRDRRRAASLDEEARLAADDVVGRDVRERAVVGGGG